MSRDFLTFYVDMKLSNETDLDKIVERYRVANNPDVYYGGEGEVEIKPSLYIHSRHFVCNLPSWPIQYFRLYLINSF